MEAKQQAHEHLQNNSRAAREMVRCRPMEKFPDGARGFVTEFQLGNRALKTRRLNDEG